MERKITENIPIPSSSHQEKLAYSFFQLIQNFQISQSDLDSYLIQGLNLNFHHKNPEYNSFLQYSCLSKNLFLTKLLLFRGANPNIIDDLGYNIIDNVILRDLSEEDYDIIFIEEIIKILLEFNVKKEIHSIVRGWHCGELIRNSPFLKNFIQSCSIKET